MISGAKQSEEELPESLEDSTTWALRMARSKIVFEVASSCKKWGRRTIRVQGLPPHITLYGIVGVMYTPDLPKRYLAIISNSEGNVIAFAHCDEIKRRV